MNDIQLDILRTMRAKLMAAPASRKRDEAFARFNRMLDQIKEIRPRIFMQLEAGSIADEAELEAVGQLEWERVVLDGWERPL
jgi:hypothetical protein